MLQASPSAATGGGSPPAGPTRMSSASSTSLTRRLEAPCWSTRRRKTPRTASPDGRNVAVQADDVVRVLNVSTGGPRYDPLEVEYGISGVAWSPNGRWLATVGMAGGDLLGRGYGRHVEHLRTQTAVNRLAWSGGFALSRDRRDRSGTRGRDLEDRATDASPSAPSSCPGDSRRRRWPGVLAGSDRVIAGANGGHAGEGVGHRLEWQVKISIPSVERFGDVAFMPDGSHLLAVGADGRMRLWGLSGPSTERRSGRRWASPRSRSRRWIHRRHAPLHERGRGWEDRLGRTPLRDRRPWLGGRRGLEP